MMMILRNHGLLAGERTIAEAFINLWLMELTLSQIQTSVDQSGVKQIPISEGILNRSAKLLAVPNMGQPAESLGFGTMKRVLEKKDPSYKL